jgi:hypothetical protein
MTAAVTALRILPARISLVATATLDMIVVPSRRYAYLAIWSIRVSERLKRGPESG